MTTIPSVSSTIRYSLYHIKSSTVQHWEMFNDFLISRISGHGNVPKERSPDGDNVPDNTETESRTPKQTPNQDDRKSLICNINVHP